MEDSNSDSSSVTDFLSLESNSICGYDTETCDSLITGFEQCKVVEKKILTPQHFDTQENLEVTGSSSETVSNSDVSNANIFVRNSTVDSQENSFNDKHTDRKMTHEVGVNTDRSFNHKVTNFRQPYFKFKKHLNHYHNFKRTYNNFNATSRKQQKTMKNYRNLNTNHKFHNRWQFQKPEWQEDRAARGFYFFTQMMKCFNQEF